MIPKALYHDSNHTYNLDQLEQLDLPFDFVEIVKRQAHSVGCLVFERFLCKKEGGWGFTHNVPTLAQQFQEVELGEQEPFQNEFAPGFGTAFLVGKQLVLTAAYCISDAYSHMPSARIIDTARLVFGFHDVKQKRSDYFFTESQVCKISVVAYQYFKMPGKNTAYSEWTDWALLRLDREVPYAPLPLNLTEKTADKIELYMLGHPRGLPLKFTYKGHVYGNKENDFFECDLDAFEGNAGSFVANMSSYKSEGMLCQGNPGYEITSDYQGTGKRRMQARKITIKEINRHRIGERLANCQRMHVLRRLIDIDLINLEIESEGSAPLLLMQSLKECTQNRNMIIRTLDKPLPIDTIFIEPMLICNNSDMKKRPLSLHTLFEKQGDIIPKQLLILGQGGIGKSTLCQYMAYQWAQNKLWNDKFDALFLIPLEKLQNVHSAETLSSIIYRLCFTEKVQKLTTKDIRDYLKQNAERILFVIDGLDEVTFAEESPQKKILDELLTFPNWIITSPTKEDLIRSDIVIENIGFASKTTDLYIHKSFQENAEAIVQKIHHNPPIISALTSNPTHLEIMCAVLRRAKEPLSMTNLLESLVLTLQKRFFEKIGRPEAWNWIEKDFKIDEQSCEIFKLVEETAWTAMQTKSISTFLNFVSEKNYAFNHLTFQEFFAARYLVRLLGDKPTEAAKLIKEVKFDPSFKVVMWFVAGLLKNEMDNLNAFFDLLDTPKDSGGFYAALLKVRCLEECGWPEQLQNLKSYEKDITFWCECLTRNPLIASMANHLIETFEISPQGAKRILIPLITSRPLDEGPIHILGRVGQGNPHQIIYLLTKLLKDEDWCIREAAVKVLGQLGWVDPLPVIYTLPLKDEHERVKEATIRALGQLGGNHTKVVFQLINDILNNKPDSATGDFLIKIGQTNPDVLTPLQDELKDKDMEVRQIAAHVFGSIGQMHPDLALSLLPDILNNEDAMIRVAAMHVLDKIAETHPNLVLPFLVEALKDENHFVRSMAIKALSKIGQTIPRVLALIIEALKDMDMDVRKDAILALQKFSGIDIKTLSLLAEALEDEETKPGALKALGKLGQDFPDFVLPLIAKALKDKSRVVRIAALNALGKFSGNHSQFVLPLINEAFKSEDEGVRCSAIWALRKLNLEDLNKFYSVLESILKGKEDGEKEITIRTLEKIGQNYPKFVLPLLFIGLESQHKWVRAYTVGALGNMGQGDVQSVVPLLIEALRDKACEVREYATEALKKFDLSFILKSKQDVLFDLYNRDKIFIFISTPLSALIDRYKNALSDQSIYSSTIAIKCIEENLSIFQQENTLCFYEGGNLCKIDFPKADEFLIQIEKCVSRYPEFILLPTKKTEKKECSIQ